MQSFASRIRPGEREQLLDQRGCTLRFEQDVAQGLFVFRFVARPAQREFRFRANQ